MRAWIRAIKSTPGALVDMQEDLLRMIAAEDSLTKANTYDELQLQKGKVVGIKSVLMRLNETKE